MQRLRVVFSLVVLLGLGVFATGCVNMDAVKTFATSAQDMAGASDKFYQQELDTYVTLASVANPLIKNPSFNKALYGSDLPGTQQAIILENRRHAVAVAALGTYAKTLNDFAALDESDHIEKSAKELDTALNSLAKQLSGSAIQADGILAGAIEAVAKIFIDLKKQQVIHEKVLQAREPVNTIIQILRDDIKKQHDRLANTRAALGSTREIWFSGLKKDFGTASLSDQAMRELTAAKIIADELNDQMSAPSQQAVLKKLDQTATSCQKAHEALMSSKIDVGAIVRFYNDVQDLKSAVGKFK